MVCRFLNLFPSEGLSEFQAIIGFHLLTQNVDHSNSVVLFLPPPSLSSTLVNLRNLPGIEVMRFFFG